MRQERLWQGHIRSNIAGHKKELLLLQHEMGARGDFEQRRDMTDRISLAGALKEAEKGEREKATAIVQVGQVGPGTTIGLVWVT